MMLVERNIAIGGCGQNVVLVYILEQCNVIQHDNSGEEIFYFEQKKIENVEPVLKDHKNVVSEDRWPLMTGSVNTEIYCKNGWSLKTGFTVQSI